MASLLGETLSFLLLAGGTVLLVAEAMAPGAHFFVLGVALLTAGIVGLLLPASLGILAPVVLALVVLGATGLTLWGYRQIDIRQGEGSGRTTSSSTLRGQFGRVTERVTPQEGEVKLDDGGFNPYYRARSVDEEIPVGTEVMVVDPGGGNVVTVEPVAGEDEIDRELARGRERDDEELESDADTA